MQVEHVLPLMSLAPVGAARSSAPTSRTVDVVLGRVSLAYTATSPVGLPHGADLRVLLALLAHAADDGQVRMGVPALLRAAQFGAGGRQHAAVFAALDRLGAAHYTVTRAPSALGLPPTFTLVTWAGQAPDGELHVELGPDLAAQLRGARARPARRAADVPNAALALYGVLETLRRVPGLDGEPGWRLPVAATCALLGLPGRGDNARRSLLTVAGALQTAGHVGGVQVDGRQLVIADVGPDAGLVALLRSEGLSRSSATTFARTLGEQVRPCLARAREVRQDGERRGRPVRRWTALLADVLHHPDKYDVHSRPPVSPAPNGAQPLGRAYEVKNAGRPATAGDMPVAAEGRLRPSALWRHKGTRALVMIRSVEGSRYVLDNGEQVNAVDLHRRYDFEAAPSGAST